MSKKVVFHWPCQHIQGVRISEICRKSSKFRFFGGKNEDRKKAAEISSFFRFLADLGAVLGTGNWPKIGKNGALKNDRKKDRKSHLTRISGRWCGGLRTAAGEVRRGTLRVRNHSGRSRGNLTRQAPRWGTANTPSWVLPRARAFRRSVSRTRFCPAFFRFFRPPKSAPFSESPKTDSGSVLDPQIGAKIN